MQNGFDFEHPETEIAKTIIAEEQNSSKHSGRKEGDNSHQEIYVSVFFFFNHYS
ncbi:hypothetical protein ACSYGW_10530 [Bacillus glycinifermentans]|uniref:hypothetical protein n=1 Tax=Bacillus glycinifermentans TaxID=1664069 RepID=UPI00405A1ABD